MTFEIKEHRWEESGTRHAATYYPFVNGEPAPELASCSHCTKYRGDETCAEWAGKEEEPPVFCGPICFAFERR